MKDVKNGIILKHSCTEYVFLLVMVCITLLSTLLLLISVSHQFSRYYSFVVNSNMFKIDHSLAYLCCRHFPYMGFLLCHREKVPFLGPCRVGSVGSMSASRTVGREFASRPGHTKDHHKNGTNCLPA